MDIGVLILAVGAVLATGLFSTSLASRLGVPALTLFVGLGIVVSKDALGIIVFDDYELAQAVGIVALSLILFEGGLASSWDELRTSWSSAAILATLGVLVTAVVTGLFAIWIFNFTLLEGLLLGAVLSATDSAAIFALLRGSTLRRRLARTLEAEAGFNDPVAILLVIGFISFIQEPGYGFIDLVVQLTSELGIGALVGIFIGKGAVSILGKTRLPGGGLYPVATIAIAALAYGAADVLHGSGFMSVYLAGVCLGGAFIPAKRSITSFHDGLAWVAQIGMFFLLGLLVLPSQLADIGWQSLLLALVLIFIARPLAVMISTAWHPFDWRDRLTLSWAGLRGATPVILATFPVVAGVPGSTEFFQIVFFAVLASILLQGASFEPLAKRLGVTSTVPALPKLLTETGVIQGLGGEVVEYEVGTEDAIVGGRVRDLGLPREAVMIVIVRGEQAIPPRGSTRLEAGDHLHFLVRQEVAQKIPRLIEKWEIGTLERVTLNRNLRARAGIFTMRPWDEMDGDPEKPRSIGGVRVFDYLRTRHDKPGALVQTVDGRYALTGASLAFGSRRSVQTYALDHIKRSKSEAERIWWREVIGALSDEQ